MRCVGDRIHTRSVADREARGCVIDDARSRNQSRIDATACASGEPITILSSARLIVALRAVSPQLRVFAGRGWGSVLLRVLPLASLLAACALSSSVSPRTWLDERTAATVTAQEPTAVFAHEEQTRAANARDYVQIGAVEVNRAGSRRYYLVLYSWSTIDRATVERDAIDDELVRSTLWADDRPIQLQRAPEGRTAAGVATSPFAAPAPSAIESWYPVTVSEIRALARARTLRLVAHGAATRREYQPWQGNQHGFAGFLRHIGAAH